MTTYLRRERDGEEAISKISAAAYRMFDVWRELANMAV